MTRPITFESIIHFDRRGRGGRKDMRTGERAVSSVPAGRVPRISRLMALAIRFEQMVRTGEVADYAELARLGHVSRARITQIMNLRLLAPDLQERLLFLPRIDSGRDTIYLRQLQPIAAEPDWRKQRRLWKMLLGHSERPDCGRENQRAHWEST
jgi:hypothetical protein